MPARFRKGYVGCTMHMRISQDVVADCFVSSSSLLCSQPENLLLKDKETNAGIKIADFGFAAVVKGDERPLKTFCGTLWYVTGQ